MTQPNDQLQQGSWISDEARAELEAAKERLAELESAFRLHFAVAPDDPLMITAPEKELYALKAVSPCGHEARYNFSSDAGKTYFCIACAFFESSGNGR